MTHENISHNVLCLTQASVLLNGYWEHAEVYLKKKKKSLLLVSNDKAFFPAINLYLCPVKCINTVVYCQEATWDNKKIK